ncbi:unnamed protein product, partial [Closterium sp. NIES-54]
MGDAWKTHHSHFFSSLPFIPPFTTNVAASASGGGGSRGRVGALGSDQIAQGVGGETRGKHILSYHPSAHFSLPLIARLSRCGRGGAWKSHPLLPPLCPFLPSTPYQMWPLVPVAVVAVGGAWAYWAQTNSPREWEGGRRKGIVPFLKPQSYYDSKGVKTVEVYYRNSRGIEIFTKRWQPLDGVVKGIVVYCHGYGDTCTYHFDAVAVSMAQQQYLVYGMDYEGHGCSQGLHAYIPRFDTIIDDVVEFTDALRASPALSSLPVFLYGESMGGAVAIKTHWRRPDAFRGAVLLSPMCKIAEELMPPPMVVSAFLALSSIIPKVKMVPGKDISDIGMRDLANRKRAKDNPMSIRGPARVGTAVSLLRTTQEIGPRMKE